MSRKRSTMLWPDSRTPVFGGGALVSLPCSVHLGYTMPTVGTDQLPRGKQAAAAAVRTSQNSIRLPLPEYILAVVMTIAWIDWSRGRDFGAAVAAWSGAHAHSLGRTHAPAMQWVAWAATKRGQPSCCTPAREVARSKPKSSTRQ